MKKEIKYQTDIDPSTKVFVLALIGGIFVIPGGFAIAAHFMNRRNEEDGLGVPTTSDAIGRVAASVNGFRCISNNYPLQFGTCHPDVRILQQHLKRLGAVPGNTGTNKDGIDDRFGTQTRAAAKKYLNKEVFNVQDIQKIKKA